MTCAQFDIALSDYLDGTLAAAGKAEFEQHMASCPACAELARDAGEALEFIERVADIEPPPELVNHLYAIASQEARPSVRGGVRAWFRRVFHPVMQPRMAFGLSLTILFFGMMVRCAGIPERHLTAADVDPAHVLAGVEDRAHRGWERSVKFYENLRFVYQIQSRLREWRDQQDQDAVTAPAENNDARRVPVHNKRPAQDLGKPGAGATPKK